MTHPIEAVTATALGLALDAASMRQQATAANIANANAAGYVPVSVDFESQLEDARRALASGSRMDMSSLSDVAPRLESALQSDPLGLSPRVLLDVEVGRMAQNAVHYQALVKGLSRHYAILSTAVSDGKK
jgi:flagellar basal-body rod protein FlgB